MALSVRSSLVALVAALALGCSSSTAEKPAAATPADPIPAALIRPVRATATLPGDPDDPAIWVNRQDPASSLILGTLKMPAPDGGLAVFGLDGSLRQILKGPDRPNNVDVEYGLDLDGSPTDIAVVTERLGRRLRVYGIARDGSSLRDLSSGAMPILVGAPGDEGAPMGIGLYRRPKDGTVYAIVAPKAGPRSGYLWQYRLEDDSTGRVKATLVRRFGDFSGSGEIEAVAVDDDAGFVYYADEVSGVHKWLADPDAPNAGIEQGFFAREGYLQDREGLGVYAGPNGEGYVVSVDQLPGESIFHIYPRTPGAAGDNRPLVTFRAPADSTDGLDVTSEPLGPDFPHGLLVAMNSSARNFMLFDWRDVSLALVQNTAAEKQEAGRRK